MNEANEEKIRELYLEIQQKRAALTELQKSATPQPVVNYKFDTTNGSIFLTDLFEEKKELFLIHNMGTSCSYCTLWADGLNGMYDHLRNRAAIAISSPDAPEAQENFRRSRDWKFSMVSVQNNRCAHDMGFANQQGYHPGVSVLVKDGETISRVSKTPFGPGDDFCAAWHLFSMLPAGADNWQPKINY